MKNVHKDINEAYIEILKEIKENGKIKAKRKEVPFLTFTLENMDKNMLFFPFALKNWAWILRECSDRIFNIKNPGISYLFSKNWENRLQNNGLYSYHYSNRLRDQMKNILSKKINSRDKIVNIWENDDINLNGRQPCTIIMQPIMEYDNKISLVVYMRNNDMINIFPSDIFIHTSYFKYWCVKNNLEYKNLYWISAVAYYQKKRDILNFPQRLIDQWKYNYHNIKTTKWDKNLVEELILKEEHEFKMINSKGDRSQEILTFISNLKNDYIKEWYKITGLKVARINNNKDIFYHIYNSEWNTEFKFIKDYIKYR
jgi:hypothetical protein